MIRDVRSRALHFQAYLCLHNHHSNLHNALWQMSRMLSRHESVDDEFELRGVEETENLVSKDINNRGGGNVSRGSVNFELFYFSRSYCHYRVPFTVRSAQQVLLCAHLTLPLSCISMLYYAKLVCNFLLENLQARS